MTEYIVVRSEEPMGTARCAVHAETIAEQLERLNTMLTHFAIGQFNGNELSKVGVDNPHHAILLDVPSSITISRNGITCVVVPDSKSRKVTAFALLDVIMRTLVFRDLILLRNGDHTISVERAGADPDVFEIKLVCQ